MIINKRGLGIILWILSPVFLVLGIAWYMFYALGSALGSMDVQLLLLPLGSLLLAGIFSIGGYLICHPRRRIYRAAILVLYTAPAVVLAAYATYVIVHMAFLSTTDEKYAYAVIHGSSERLLHEDKAIFTVMNACLSNWRGSQKNCDIKYYLLIVREGEGNWTYTGGGTLRYLWKKTDQNGYFTEDSDTRKLELELNRGPVITVSGHNVPLGSGEIIIVKLDSNWEAHVARGTTALENIKLTELNRYFVTNCVSGGKCSGK